MPPAPQSAAPHPALLSVLCPHCNTPLARVARADGDLAACLSCGVYGEYRVLIEQGVLTGGTLSEREIEGFCAELGGLRDQAARAEAMDRGD
jgi:hypothetical protein